MLTDPIADMLTRIRNGVRVERPHVEVTTSKVKRGLADVLKREGGCNVNRVAEHFDGELTRFAVMKHLATLEQAGLVIAEREGRDKRLWLNATPIQWIHERWTTEFSAYWAARLTRLKFAAEGAEVTRLPAPATRRKKGPAHG